MTTPNATVTYMRLYTLARRGPTESREPVDVDGVVLLVGDRMVLDFTDRHSDAGHDRVMMFPAFLDGVQCWLLVRDWQAGHGYSAYGSEQRTLNLQEGIALMVERGVFALPPPLRAARVA